MDEATKETLRAIREQLEIGQEVEEDIDWEDMEPFRSDFDKIIDKFHLYSTNLKKMLKKKFRKSRKIIQDIIPEHRTGDELTRELEDAWNLYSRVVFSICSKRILT